MPKCQCGHSKEAHFGPFWECLADATPDDPSVFTSCACQKYVEDTDA